MSSSPPAETRTVTARSQAWGLSEAKVRTARCRTTLAFVLLGPIVAFAVVGFLFWGPPGLAPAAVAVAVVALIVRTTTTPLIASLDPRPADDARLRNIVGGLAQELGLDAPPIFTVSGDGINALLFWHRGRPALGFTAATRRGLARTELEALVAHCLTRIEPGGGGLDRVALRFGGTFRTCALGVGARDDVRTAAITRYPPALAKTIEKAHPATGRFAYLWFAAEDRSHTPPSERAAALQDL